MNHFHPSILSPAALPAKDTFSRKSEKQAPGGDQLTPVAQRRVLKVPRVKLCDRLVRTKETIDLIAGRQHTLPPVSSRAGRPPRWELCGELLTEGGAPGLDLRISSQVASSRDLADAEHERDGLRKAGLPE
jgi:hypothetical protein